MFEVYDQQGKIVAEAPDFGGIELAVECALAEGHDVVAVYDGDVRVYDAEYTGETQPWLGRPAISRRGADAVMRRYGPDTPARPVKEAL